MSKNGESSSRESIQRDGEHMPKEEGLASRCEEPPKTSLPTAATVWSYAVDSRKGEGLDVRATEWALTDYNLKEGDDLVRRQDVLEMINKIHGQVLKEYAYDASIAWGAKILMRELKYRIDPEIDFKEDIR